MWDGTLHLVGEIERCEAAGATAAAVTMAYVCIITMACLPLPADRDRHGRGDFIAWVDTYLCGHEDQTYQYWGIDVYGARCAVLHGFGAQADYHRRPPQAIVFGYHNGGRHNFDRQIDARLVLIGTDSFLDNVALAVQTFIGACKADADRVCVWLQVFPRYRLYFRFLCPRAQYAEGVVHG